ncbi:MAG TPA: MerR family transcriptional regulator [Chloroflexia bacterium]|jgi:DNA-binding transcriptional MerR regulator
MRPANTYLIREFARLTGVTARTLHYYDQIGLLAPSLRTEAEHRLYTQGDALKLQQIVTLKYMGYSLSEIRNLLKNPARNVQQSLRLQKMAIDERIAQLQQVSRALEATLGAATNGDLEGLPWEHLSIIIKGVTMGPSKESQEWVQQFYTEEQSQMLAERASKMSQADIDAATQGWADVYAGFKARMHLPPDHPEVQALVAKMQQLIEGFTGGDPGIRQSLERMYSKPEEVPTDIRPYDPDLQSFMDKAMSHYNQTHGK